VEEVCQAVSTFKRVADELDVTHRINDIARDIGRRTAALGAVAA
jgi:hypothetical protein